MSHLTSLSVVLSFVKPGQYQQSHRFVVASRERTLAQCLVQSCTRQSSVLGEEVAVFTGVGVTGRCYNTEEDGLPVSISAKETGFN